MFASSQLLSLSYSAAGNYLQQVICPWKVLDVLYNYIQSLGSSLGEGWMEHRKGCCPRASASPTAYLGNSCIIGPDTKVYHSTLVRSRALIGQDCVIGNSVKLKNAISMDRVPLLLCLQQGEQCPDCYAHSGSSSALLGITARRTSLGALPDRRRLQRNRHSFGAAVSCFFQADCSSHLNPGTIAGACIRIPLPAVSGAFSFSQSHRMLRKSE